MKSFYDIVFITHIPAFYKVNLYNNISKNKKIFVFFISEGTVSKRSDDFLTLSDAEFEYKVINKGNFEERSVLKSCALLLFCFQGKQYKKLVVQGWDLVEFWLLVFLSPAKKNALVLESTINESKISGLAYKLKILFMKRIKAVYASGTGQSKLLGALGFNGKIIVTKGVGIIRKSETFEYKSSGLRNRILYIGRLSEEKNLVSLVSAFSKLDWLKLDVYGEGPLKADLLEISSNNVSILGALPNRELCSIFNNYDALILPSYFEPWGLVVEESLYFGLPVIVSAQCGASDLIYESGYGIVFEDNNIEKSILDFYDIRNGLLLDGRKYIDLKDDGQVNCY